MSNHSFGHWSIEISTKIKQWIQIKEFENGTCFSGLIFHSVYNYTLVQLSVAQKLLVNFLNWQVKIKNDDGFPGKAMGCDSGDTSSIYNSGSRPTQFGQITTASVSHLYNEIMLPFPSFLVQLSFLWSQELFQARTGFMTQLRRDSTPVSVGISDCYCMISRFQIVRHS